MITTDSYSPDSKEAEYRLALYSDKSNHQSVFNRNSYLKDPTTLLDDTEGVIDLTNNDQESLDRGKMKNIDNLLIEQDLLVPERPHSEFFNGNVDIEEHFRKNVSEIVPFERESLVEEDDSPTEYDAKRSHILFLEKRLPLIDIGESTDSLMPSGKVQNEQSKTCSIML